jgi:SAM-dependent methyltransferase
LFDVWHHLEHPANALAEFRRVLVPRGRVILLEPAMSVVGRMVYGSCHHEPLGFNTSLSDQLTDLSGPNSTPYFAAQSSAHRIFVRRELPGLLDGWEIRTIRPIISFAYLGSGGFRGPQLYPQAFYQLVKLADRILGLAPSLFAARLLVCISKKAMKIQEIAPGCAAHLKLVSGFYQAESRPSIFTTAYRDSDATCKNSLASLARA